MQRCLEYFMKSSLVTSCDANQTKKFCNEKKTYQDVILLEFCKAVRHIERQYSKGYEVYSKEKSLTSYGYIFKYKTSA